LSRGIVDFAIGTGPHGAESACVVQTPQGPEILSTRIGNLIDENSSPQLNKFVLQTICNFDVAQQKVRLSKVSTTTISWNKSPCRQGLIRNYFVSI